uniref:SAM domain-containing protein n=1 Tax=Eptatretus burgeri TaxID=7764 RepID=A0A8C4QT67_EPTBU
MADHGRRQRSGIILEEDASWHVPLQTGKICSRSWWLRIVFPFFSLAIQLILSLLAPQSAMESNVPRRPQRTPNALQDGAARIRIKQGRTSVRRVTEKSAPQLVSFILKQLQENDLHDFLSGLQLAHLTLYFQAHRVSFHSLLSMTAQDLAKIGVLKMGEQQKILWAVENVHRKGWDPNCLPCKCTRSWWTTNQRK